MDEDWNFWWREDEWEDDDDDLFWDEKWGDEDVPF